MTSGMIYWLTRLDGIVTFAAVVMALFTLAAIILGIIGGIENSENTKKAAKKCGIIAVITAIIGTFVPTSKEMAAIYLIPKIVNNEQVKDVPSKGMEILNLKLDGWIDDMKGIKGKK